MEEDTILCPHKGEDGKLCQLKLKSKFKFCPDCGGKVNLAWFQQGKYKHMFFKSSCATNPFL